MENTQPKTHQELLAALKKQIEYYFSRENLSNDSYLVSLMDDSGYVSLERIACFHKVLALSNNMDDILEALKDSEVVVVDQESNRVRPAITFERKTIILRDVPKETTEEEIRSLFKGMGEVESAKMEFEGTWFVVMDSEKSAVAALELLRQRTLHDQAVKARLKNESYLKNLIKELTTSADGIPAEYLPMSNPPLFMGYGNPSMMMNFQQNAVFGQSFAASNENRGRKNRKEHKHRERRSRAVSQPKTVPALQSAEIFPPLVPTTSPQVGKIDVKYSYSEICEIVKGVKDLSCPPIASSGVESALVETANQELVQKGRTFSIDQALQRGCPRTMSVDSIDYTSMIQGEKINP